MRMLLISTAWLLIIILIWAFFYYMSIEKAIDYFDKKLMKIYEAAINEKFDEAKLNLDMVLNRWKKEEELWIYFVHQGDVDNIDSSILKIDAFIKTENKSMILYEVEELKKYLKMIKGNESLTLENIF